MTRITDNGWMKRAIQLILAILFLAVSLILLVWGFWPPKRETRVTQLTSNGGDPSLTEARNIRLEYTPVARAGESEVIRLYLEPGEAYQADALYDAYNIIAEARMEMPFADFRPTNILSTPLLPGNTASFYWEVTPRERVALHGTIWVYLRFIPKTGGEETRVTVSAQDATIRSKSLLGRTGREARVAGVVSLLAGSILGTPFFNYIRAKRKNKNMTNITQKIDT